MRLPFGLYFLGVVSLAHGIRYGVNLLLSDEKNILTPWRRAGAGLSRRAPETVGVRLFADAASAQLAGTLQNLIFEAGRGRRIDRAVDPNALVALLLTEYRDAQAIRPQRAG